MRTKALGAIVFLGVVLLPGLCFAQSVSGPNQCEGGLGNAVAYFHPGPNKCGSGSGYDVSTGQTSGLNCSREPTSRSR